MQNLSQLNVTENLYFESYLQICDSDCIQFFSLHERLEESEAQVGGGARAGGGRAGGGTRALRPSGPGGPAAARQDGGDDVGH